MASRQKRSFACPGMKLVDVDLFGRGWFHFAARPVDQKLAS
jgi:hypothetical protein